ncbi:MAG: tRNA (N6-threonylcarbamoyladenosine(37)-N6)-methyltransferase TrmO [Bdellovibrionota bacterium]
MPLSHSDRRLLQRLIETGHALEKLWPDGEAISERIECASSPCDADIAESEERKTLLSKLKNYICECAEAHDEDLKRLAFHERDLTETMTARHLGTILVPFERLLGRTLRDDEFLVTDTDDRERVRDVRPLRVVVDNIRSAFNVGAIMRTSECFGAEHVHLTGYTPTPDEKKTAQTSLGANEAIPWSTAPDAKATIEDLKREGYTIVALETAERAVELDSFVWPERVGLLLGNERFGVDRDTLALADHVVRIPMYGRKNSLNVGIACGIALAHWREHLSDRAVTYSPIGVFRSPAVHPYEATRQGSVEKVSEIGVIELESRRDFEQALSDLEGFERAWIVYDFHHNPNWKPMVKPPRGPATKRGVFATRSPYRPNSIGLSSVEIVKVEGLRVHVRGFDLLDGTPVLDIKPYLPYADAFPAARAGWTEGLDDAAYEVKFSERAIGQLAWLEERGVSQLRGFLISQLEFDPLDDSRKRLMTSPLGAENVSTAPSFHRIAYRTWRADFRVDGRTVVIEGFVSGYSDDDLAAVVDTYADKLLHRSFKTAFR